MPIDVQCPCGRTSVVPDQHAGKKAKCPACGAVVVIPGASRVVPTETHHSLAIQALPGRVGVARPTAHEPEPAVSVLYAPQFLHLARGFR